MVGIAASNTAPSCREKSAAKATVRSKQSAEAESVFGQVIHQGTIDGITDSCHKLRLGPLPIIFVLPPESRFTTAYRRLRRDWDGEAKSKVDLGRHPLNFASLLTVDEETVQQTVVNCLSERKRSAIVMAATGICSSGRIVIFLKPILKDKHNIIFVGYQATVIPGRDIQAFGSGNGYENIEDEHYATNPGVETINGYSGHADQKYLRKFQHQMLKQSEVVRIVHGCESAKYSLKRKTLDGYPAQRVTGTVRKP